MYLLRSPFFFWHHLQLAPHAPMVRVVLQLSLSSLGITLETHCGGPSLALPSLLNLQRLDLVLIHAGK